MRNHPIDVKLSKDTLSKLDYVCDMLQGSRTEVIEKMIENSYKRLLSARLLEAA